MLVTSSSDILYRWFNPIFHFGCNSYFHFFISRYFFLKKPALVKTILGSHYIFCSQIGGALLFVSYVSSKLLTDLNTSFFSGRYTIVIVNLICILLISSVFIRYVFNQYIKNVGKVFKWILSFCLIGGLFFTTDFYARFTKASHVRALKAAHAKYGSAKIDFRLIAFTTDEGESTKSCGLLEIASGDSLERYDMSIFPIEQFIQPVFYSYDLPEEKVCTRFIKH